MNSLRMPVSACQLPTLFSTSLFLAVSCSSLRLCLSLLLRRRHQGAREVHAADERGHGEHRSPRYDGILFLLIADQSAFPVEDSNLILLFLFLFFYAGVFTGAIIRMISDIRAKHGKDSVNLNYCGKFTLAEDLSDIKDITSIDLRNISSLKGT